MLHCLADGHRHRHGARAEEWRAADPDSFEPRMDVGPQREGESAA